METVSLLKITEHTIQVRATGLTTRQVDDAIQQLFKGNKVIVKDHYKLGESFVCNSYLLDKILRRLAQEHSIYKEKNINVEKKGVHFLVNLKGNWKRIIE